MDVLVDVLGRCRGVSWLKLLEMERGVLVEVAGNVEGCLG